jgi:hypothetical protein
MTEAEIRADARRTLAEYQADGRWPTEPPAEAQAKVGRVLSEHLARKPAAAPRRRTA